MTGVELIAAERKRQIAELGYDQVHDMEHRADQLSSAGAWLALPPRIRAGEEGDDLAPLLIPEGWVLRGNTSRIRELQKAGALIAAEIDRLIADGWGGY